MTPARKIVLLQRLAAAIVIAVGALVLYMVFIFRPR